MAAAAGVDCSAKKVRASVGYSEEMEMIPMKHCHLKGIPSGNLMGFIVI
jgi:hypothetical protein